MLNFLLFVIFATNANYCTSGCYMYPRVPYTLNDGEEIASVESTTQNKCLHFCVQGSLCVWVKYDGDRNVCTLFRETPSVPRTPFSLRNEWSFEKLCNGLTPTIMGAFIITDMPSSADLVSNSIQKTEFICANTCLINAVCDAYIYHDTNKTCSMYKGNSTGEYSCLTSMNCFVKL